MRSWRTPRPASIRLNVVTRDAPGDDGTARPQCRAIKHQDGMVHLKSDQPGE